MFASVPGLLMLQAAQRNRNAIRVTQTCTKDERHLLEGLHVQVAQRLVALKIAQWDCSAVYIVRPAEYLWYIYGHSRHWTKSAMLSCRASAPQCHRRVRCVHVVLHRRIGALHVDSM